MNHFSQNFLNINLKINHAEARDLAWKILSKTVTGNVTSNYKGKKKQNKTKRWLILLMAAHNIQMAFA